MEKGIRGVMDELSTNIAGVVALAPVMLKLIEDSLDLNIEDHIKISELKVCGSCSGCVVIILPL